MRRLSRRMDKYESFTKSVNWNGYGILIITKKTRQVWYANGEVSQYIVPSMLRKEAISHI